MKLQIPRHSNKSLKIAAANFLDELHPSREIPIPIEKIAEVDLKIAIIPIPNLKKITSVDGFISGNLKEIRIDDEVYNQYPERERFTVAHELGHFYLHSKVYESINVDSIDDYCKFLQRVDREDYGWLEWQAYAFAGLVLVPPEILAARFKEVVRNIGGIGKGMRRDEKLYLVGEQLSNEFGVSSQVIRKRVERDSLLTGMKI